MARYTTTTEELTSIANAIRTASGTSSQLVYPTGFVSAINQLGVPTTYTYNPFGEEMEFVQNLQTYNLTLADTDFSSWTPSTSTGTILGTTNGNSYTPTDADQQFVLLTQGKIIYNYTTEVENKAKMIETYYTAVYYVIKIFNGATNFINGNKTYYSYVTGPNYQTSLYYNSSGSYSITGNTNGIYITHQSPTLSNQNTSKPTITIKRPLIRAVAHNDYMTTANFNALDTANTTITMTIDLYAGNASKTNVVSKIFDNLHNLYTAQHTTT